MIVNDLKISYQTVCSMMHNILKAMADRDAQYTLSDLVKIEDFHIHAPTKNGNRERGTDKNRALVALSKNKKGHPLLVKMEVIANIKKKVFRSTG
ncbi:hypothetical protein BK133_18560 [Paenibacillus sp. FSL H8-0548]|nr:hypothetical protein BK133_18560 [Paenibacillus sp. FSL H8-0548]